MAVASHAHDQTVLTSHRITEGDTLTQSVTWTGGLQVAAPLVDLVPGQASSGVRVVDFTAADGGGWLLELEGEAGRDYDLRLFGVQARISEASGGVTAEIRRAEARSSDVDVSAEAPRADAFLLHVRFPDGTGRRLASVRLRPGDGA
ncbi:MAG: hypothetical protein FJ000_10965 [Actinobacteria bacterium]|nr:hypothetical protein [Actinomycetota bacterium]